MDMPLTGGAEKLISNSCTYPYSLIGTGFNETRPKFLLFGAVKLSGMSETVEFLEEIPAL